MVFFRVKMKGGRSYNYLVLNFKHDGKTFQVQRYIGVGRMGKQRKDELIREHRDRLLDEALRKRASLSAARFTSTVLGLSELELLERIRLIYSEYRRRFYPNEVVHLERDLELNYIHSTTATEGNTSTLEEVTRLLEDGISPKGRSLREVYEIRNFEDVLEFRKKGGKDISMRTILRLHGLVMRDIDEFTLGALRRIEVGIRGSDVRLVPAIFVEEELYKLLSWHDKEKERGKMHPVELAARFHARFEEIHPFTDGNGRVGRELFNRTVIKWGFPPLNFNVKRRDEYLDGLVSAGHGGFPPLLEYMIENYKEQMRTRLGNHPLKDVLNG